MTPPEKAAAIAAAVGSRQVTLSVSGVSIEVTGCLAYGPAVYLTVVAAWTGAGANRVYLPLDNPYIFVNPPLSADGGATRNDLAAARQMVYESVTSAARRMGWTG